MKAESPSPALLDRLGSLADETRLRILLLCEAQELGVAELCEIVQLPQSTVSRHLRVLADLGWLQSRRQATSHLYRMSQRLDEDASQLWSIARAHVSSWPAARHDALRQSAILARRRGAAEGFFEGAAARWENLRAELYGESFEAAALATFLDRRWTVADLGCGTGGLSRAIAAGVRRVIAVDASPSMLDAARVNLADAPNVLLRAGALEDLPIETRSCEAAVMLLALTYVAGPARALAEAARILKPDGRLVLVDLLRHERSDFAHEMGHVHAGFEPDEVTTLLTEAGFASVTCRALPAHARARGPALILATGLRPARSTATKERGRIPARRKRS